MIVPARLKPGTDEWNRFFYPTPTHEEIITRVRSYSESKRSEDEKFLFEMFKHFPENKTKEIINMKVGTLLDYMGNSKWVNQDRVVKKILSEKDFDKKLQRGVKTIVDKITDSSRSKHDKYDSVARFYCAFHYPQHYLPAHWIEPALWEYERLDHFLQGEKFYWGKRYTPYVKQFNKFVDFYGMQDYSAWHLHIFLDQLHSTELREREHRFPCNEVMRSTSNSYNLSIINAANRKDED